MFERALQEWVAEAGAELAIFCDFEGESIAMAAGDLDPFDVRVIGAHQALVVDRLQRIARASGQSERLALAWVSEARVLLVEALPGGYYVLAGLRADARAGALWPLAQRRLAGLAARFAAEL